MQRTGQAQLQAKTHCVFRRNELLNKLIYLMWHNRQHPQEGSHCTVYALCKQVYSISHQALVIDAHETTNMGQSDPSGALLQVQDQLQEVLASVNVIHHLSTLLDIN